MEYTLEHIAMGYSEPLEAYKKMVGAMIERVEKGGVKFAPISKVLTTFGRESLSLRTSVIGVV